jgi:hypothetical protein
MSAGFTSAHHRRPLLLVVLLLLPGLVATLTAVPTALAAQGGGFAVRFQGTLTLGGATAAGHQILALVARTPTDTTVCGTATSGVDGAYTLDIPRDPRCVRATRAALLPTWLFLVNGEQVGQTNRGILLDPPSAPLTVPNFRLAGKTVPGQTAPAMNLDTGSGGSVPTSGRELIVVRYFGVLTSGDTAGAAARPAPRGTVVSVVGDVGVSGGGADGRPQQPGTRPGGTEPVRLRGGISSPHRDRPTTAADGWRCRGRVPGGRAHRDPG